MQALHDAIGSGQTEIALNLMKSSVCLDKGDKFGYTPLHICAMYGRKELAVTLIEKGVQINPRDNDGKTPLKWANFTRGQETFESQTVVAEILEKHGATH